MGGRPSVESRAVKTARIQQPIGRRRDSINRFGGCRIDRLSGQPNWPQRFCGFAHFRAKSCETGLPVNGNLSPQLPKRRYLEREGFVVLYHSPHGRRSERPRNGLTSQSLAEIDEETQGVSIFDSFVRATR
jgi:hypothetical protein